MKRFLVITMLCTACMLPGRQTAAQVTQADSAAVLLGVASRLRAEGRIGLANSLVDLILERYASTPAAAEAQRLRGELRGLPEEPSGRTELMVFSTIYGLSLGVLVPAALDASDAEAYGLGLIAGGPLGFLMGRSLANSRPITEGQANAISFGTFWGMWQGFGWQQVFELGEREECVLDLCEINETGAIFSSMLIGSVAGLGTGLVISRKPIAEGTAATVNFGALWGTGYGVAVALLADLEDEDEPLTAALVGGNIGMVATALLAPSWNLSKSRARLISITGIAGLLAGAGVLLIAQPDDEKVAVAIPTATSLIGLGLGTHWTRNYDQRSDSRAPDDGALLDLRQGQWSVNVPQPGLRMIEARANNRPVYKPGIAVPLLRAAF